MELPFQACTALPQLYVAAGIAGTCSPSTLISIMLYMFFDFAQATVTFFPTVVILLLMMLFAREVVPFDLVYSAHEVISADSLSNLFDIKHSF